MNWSSVWLFVAPMSRMNSFVATEIAEPTSARSVRMRVPASVSVAWYPTSEVELTSNGLSTKVSSSEEEPGTAVSRALRVGAVVGVGGATWANAEAARADSATSNAAGTPHGGGGRIRDLIMNRGV